MYCLFCVLFVCKCVLYYWHRVAAQLQLTNISISYTPFLSPYMLHTLPTQFFSIWSPKQIFGEQYRSLSYTLCSFLHSFVTSSLLGPNIRRQYLCKLQWQDDELFENFRFCGVGAKRVNSGTETHSNTHTQYICKLCVYFSNYKHGDNAKMTSENSA
jgi:hypothetical protein